MTNDKEAVIAIHVAELKRLFNAIDPSPFRDKDLDPNAEAFIVGWAKELPRDSPIALVVQVDRPAGLPREEALLEEAVHEFFAGRGVAFRQRLSHLFRTGRTSLLIGLTFLVASVALSNLVANWLSGNHLSEVLREGLAVGGWVAMWRPIEIFLYDWWPIRDDARLSDRLATMPVRLQYTEHGPSDSWQHDWPAEPASKN